MLQIQQGMGRAQLVRSYLHNAKQSPFLRSHLKLGQAKLLSHLELSVHEAAGMLCFWILTASAGNVKQQKLVMAARGFRLLLALQSPTTQERLHQRVQTQMGYDVSSWSVAEVCDWVEEIGLGQYRRRFLHHCIDGNLLLRLTGRELKVFCCNSNPF